LSFWNRRWILEIVFSFAFIVIVTVSPLSEAALDKTTESDFFDSPEVRIDISHAFGHSVEEGNFSPRGSLLIRNFRGPKFTTEQKELSSADLQKLKATAKEDGYYFVTAKIKLPTVEKEYKTFAPAKSVLEAGLQDIFRIHLTPGGDIFSISYGARRFGSDPVRPSAKFNTTVSVHNGDIGPIPDTAPYLEKLEMERIAKERGEDGKDNRSFIAKYWMYIVPVALLVLLSSASGQEGGS
jgi:hypothetical protein